MTMDRGFIRASNNDLQVKNLAEGFADIIDAQSAGALASLGLTSSVAELNILTGVTATAAQLNKLAGATPVVAEINTLTNLPASVTTTATPATGTCGVQFVFKDSAGVAITHAISGQAYFSNSTGLAIAHATSAAVLTNGAWVDLVAGYTGMFVTTAAGLLGVTVTGGAAGYYLSFQLPNGKIITSSVLTVN